MKNLSKFALAALAITVSTAALAAAPQNRYVQHHLVANKAKYKADFVEPKLVNAWGIANRPAGAGGHIWVTAGDTSFQYIGDVHASDNPELKTLRVAEDLPVVRVPVGSKEGTTTSTVFLNTKDNFVITQELKGVEPIKAPAKFLFATDSGVVSAWTERKKEDGTFDRPVDSVSVIDESKEGTQFFGLAANKEFNRLYAANFGVNPGVKVFGADFKPLAVTFDQPFDDNKNGKVDPGEYAPFNVEALGDSIFVAYAKTQSCPAEEIKKGTCKKGDLFVGEEDTSKPGQGRVAEFTEDGKLVSVWNDEGHLSAPWGMAFAPEGFGALSGKLLVANFGSGTIAAFDPKTKTFSENMKDAKGKTLKIDKIWGLLFGNGVSLGDADALYFTAGPDDEKDGIFGSLRVAKK